MPQPARDTLAGQVYNDLRNLARRESRSTDQIMVEYVLERFLYRMSRSSRQDSRITGIARLAARRAFTPPPRVDSAVLVIRRRPR
jgi:hypothetical protein